MDTRFDTGTKISAGVHAALLGYILVGPVFQSEPLPMTVQEVSVISSAQFAAMQAAQVAPDVETEVALPQVDAPEPIEVDPPEQVDTPEIEVAPELPQPEPEPEPVAEPEPPAPPQEDVAVLAPEAETAVPQQADRIAPDPVETPDPEAAPDPVQQDEITEDTSGDVQQETQEATAPEETTTEIVTEADEPVSAAAPTRSIRPPSNRPARPVRTAEPAVEPEPSPEAAPAEDATADAIAQAVAAAQQSTPISAPSGPPLTGSELEGLRVSVERCWNVGTLSTEATETVVTAFVRMNRDGTPDNGSIRMLSFDGGSEAAARRVFDTGRRAIIRCGARGFPLPVEKYSQWREIEMTFNPEGVFWR